MMKNKLKLIITLTKTKNIVINF